MSDATTILVDTELGRDDAAAAAVELYRRLVGEGTIAPLPTSLIDPYFPIVDPGFLADNGVLAIGLHASGHRWREDGMGGAMLIDGGRENGIFCPYDGTFHIRCPECAQSLAPGEEGSEALEEALVVWCEAPDSAYVACPACANWTPLTQWRSPDHDFAVGHFAISLHGAHIRALIGGGDEHAATLLRHRLGDLASDYAVVYARG